MKQQIIVLSLFDGIACGYVALKKLFGKKWNIKYFASEIDENSIKIAMHNHPDIIQLGDVRNITKDMLPKGLYILMGGSPCQDFSMAGKKVGMVTEEKFEITSYETYMELKNLGYQFKGESYLFWEYVRLLKELKPKYFLLENVANMPKKWIDVISSVLGVEPIQINSSLVSAQNRDRLYWTNIPNVTVPEDKGVVLSDVIPGAINGYGKGGVPDGQGTWKLQRWTERKDHKSGCLTKSDSRAYITLTNGDFRLLTTSEREMLQTLPVGYTDVPGIAKTHKNGAIGNGWTVDVIAHIFSHLPSSRGS